MIFIFMHKLHGLQASVWLKEDICALNMIPLLLAISGNP